MWVGCIWDVIEVRRFGVPHFWWRWKHRKTFFIASYHVKMAWELYVVGTSLDGTELSYWVWFPCLPLCRLAWLFLLADWIYCDNLSVLQIFWGGLRLYSPDIAIHIHKLTRHHITSHTWTEDNPAHQIITTKSFCQVCWIIQIGSINLP